MENVKFWQNFFISAGFEKETSNDLSLLFYNHRLTKEMLPYLTKDHLIEMGIKIIGDIILIQNQASKFTENMRKNRCFNDNPIIKFNVTDMMEIDNIDNISQLLECKIIYNSNMDNKDTMNKGTVMKIENNSPASKDQAPAALTQLNNVNQVFTKNILHLNTYQPPRTGVSEMLTNLPHAKAVSQIKSIIIDKQVSDVILEKGKMKQIMGTYCKNKYSKSLEPFYNDRKIKTLSQGLFANMTSKGKYTGKDSVEICQRIGHIFVSTIKSHLKMKSWALNPKITINKNRPNFLIKRAKKSENHIDLKVKKTFIINGIKKENFIVASKNQIQKNLYSKVDDVDRIVQQRCAMSRTAGKCFTRKCTTTFTTKYYKSSN